MIRFYGYFRSSSSYRCRIAFNLKGVAPEFRPVHLVRDGGEQKTDAYRALNPRMLVPTVEADGQVFTQSPAILEWIDETWPEPRLLPQDRNMRAAVRAFAAVIGCDIHPLQNLRVLQYLRNEFGQDDEGIRRWCQRWLGDGLSACETLLVRRDRQTPFCFGETPGMADIYLIPQVFSAVRFDVDLGAMPLIRAIHARCESLPAFADAHPSRQVDAD